MSKSSQHVPADRLSVPHLLGIEQLSLDDVELILTETARWHDFNRRPAKHDETLRGLTVVNAFFENSTRTLVSFEIAAKRLGADLVNFNAPLSSVSKGETLLDTVATIAAMQVDAIVLRHPENGASATVARHSPCPVLNAGDGMGEHPTQALLDAFVMRQRLGTLAGKTVTICGDIRHSRVARSNILLLRMLGADLRLAGPANFLPENPGGDLPVYSNIDEAITNADAVMMLRIQRERLDIGLNVDAIDYHRTYGLTRERLQRFAPNAIVLHPGPMNRGVEIDEAVADDPEKSMVLAQVEAGVAVRMACLDLLTRPRRARSADAPVPD